MSRSMVLFRACHSASKSLGRVCLSTSWIRFNSQKDVRVWASTRSTNRAGVASSFNRSIVMPTNPNLRLLGSPILTSNLP